MQNCHSIWRISVFTAALFVAAGASARAYGGVTLSDTSQNNYDFDDVVNYTHHYTVMQPQCTDRAFAYTPEGLTELQAALAGSSQSTCKNYCQEMVPSLEQCMNLDWMNSICGHLETALINRTKSLPIDAEHPSRCIRLLNEHIDNGGWPTNLPQMLVRAEDTVQLQPDGTTVTVPASQSRRTVSIAPKLNTNTTFSGLNTTWYGYHMQAFTELSKATPDSVFTMMRNAQRAEWNNNGNTVNSCHEYIYEKYYDYSLFEDVTAPLGNNYRAIFDLAYTPGGATTPAPRYALGTQGMAGEPIRQKNGTPLYEQIHFPPDPQSKNIYFWLEPFQQSEDLFGNVHSREDIIADWQADPEAYLGGRPSTLQFLIIDDDLNALIADGVANHKFVETWQWHYDQNNALSGYLDEELYAMDRVKEDFEGLLMHRSQILRSIADYWQRMENQVNSLIPQYENEAFWDPREIMTSDPISDYLDLQRNQQRDIFEATQNVSIDFTAFVAGGAFVDVPQTSVMSAKVGPGQMPDLGSSTLMGQFGVQRMMTQVSYNGVAGSGINPNLVGDYSALPSYGFDDCSQAVNFLAGASCELAHVDAAIEDALLFARDLGCLDLDGPTWCDWSPKMFFERVQDPYGIYREPDFDACNSHSQAGFDALRQWGLFDVGENVVTTNFHGQNNVVCDSADWGAFPDEIERYIGCYDSWVALTIAELKKAMAGAGTEYSHGSFGKSYGDGVQIGGDMFGASLNFASSWHVRNMLTPVSDNYCQLQPDFHGSVSATAKALYMPVTLLAASADLQFGAGGHASASIQVLDQNVVDGYKPISPETFNIVEVQDGADERFFEVGTTFVVVIIPVTVRGGAAGQVGVAASVGGGLPSGKNTCANGDLAAFGSFTPYVGVSAFASASVNLVIAEAGIKASLELLRVDLPLTATLLFEDTNPNNPDAKLNLDTNLDLVLSLLSGRLSAFVEICYVFSCDDYETTIFSWDGPHFRRNLYHNNVNLSVLPLLGWLEGQP